MSRDFFLTRMKFSCVLVAAVMSVIFYSFYYDPDRSLKRDLRVVREVHVRGRWLVLGGDDAQVSAAVKIVAKYPQIDSIDLYGENISDASITEIAKLSNVKSLFIKKAPITDKSIYDICNMRNLSELAISGCKSVSDKGISRLSCLNSLRILSVGDGTNVSKKTLDELRLGNKELTILSSCMLF